MPAASGSSRFHAWYANGSARPIAGECYVDNSPPPPPREATVDIPVRDRGAGRPTKRDRRELEHLRGDLRAR